MQKLQDQKKSTANLKMHENFRFQTRVSFKTNKFLSKNRKIENK